MKITLGGSIPLWIQCLYLSTAWGFHVARMHSACNCYMELASFYVNYVIVYMAPPFLAGQRQK